MEVGKSEFFRFIRVKKWGSHVSRRCSAQSRCEGSPGDTGAASGRARQARRKPVDPHGPSSPLSSDLYWEPIRNKVLAGSSLEQRSALLKRLLVGYARDEEMDSAGRVLIAPELRDFAKLEKQVHLVGQGDHFELWSDEGWKQQQEAIFALGADLMPAGWETLPL